MRIHTHLHILYIYNMYIHLSNYQAIIIMSIIMMIRIIPPLLYCYCTMLNYALIFGMGMTIVIFTGATKGMEGTSRLG